MSITDNIRDVTPIFDEFTPSVGQKFQLAGMFREAGECFARGEAGLMLAKLAEIEAWTLKQIGVES